MPRRRSELVERHHESRVDEHGAQEHRFELDVPAELAVFEGHFPGHPIVPAFVILETIVRRTERCWPQLGGWTGSRSMKFKVPIPPGARLELTLRRATDSDRVAYTLSSEGKTCATGTMTLAGG